ncbi:flagellar basal body P-ring formation chaperone FlgA [Alcaligenaceae bacterium A4P071]|nr:flagellar basal body P-ring formation chaperone FlgA [Alcaligenaceae bacterium B3P038]MDQ2184159.1 flagellar basal body P-ring formation chaperone FlgA [Alcaligenaceae bacterium A4P071]
MNRSAHFLLVAALSTLGSATSVNAAPVTVSTAPDEAAMAAVETFLKQEAARVPGYTGRAEISVDRPRSADLAACDALQAFLPPGAKLRSRTSVGLRCTAPASWTTYVQATLSVPIQYFVAARPVASGQRLSMDDLESREGDALRLPFGAVTDPSTLVGMTATSRMTAGRPIRANGLRSADSVVRGQQVRITARGPGFVVNSDGHALETAPPGGTVQVRTASGQTLTGIVQRSGVVEIPI